MNYVCSDIHGCLEEFVCLLESIEFKAEDKMYILGDVLDRGEKPIELIRFIMKCPNIELLKGNHESDAYYLLSSLLSSMSDVNVKSHLSMDIYKMINSWVKDNGGGNTLKQFLDLDSETRQDILDYLKNLPVYKKIPINDQVYLLSHTFDDEAYHEGKPLNEYDENVFVYGYINHERNYFNNMKHITGHVPTPLTRSDEQPLILDYNNHLNIDCGIVYGGRLSCICLDTGKHYYIGEN